MGALSEMNQREPITSRWDASVAATLSEPELLLYRSNLLGSDLRITNFGGGNTSLHANQSYEIATGTRRKLVFLWF